MGEPRNDDERYVLNREMHAYQLLKQVEHSGLVKYHQGFMYGKYFVIVQDLAEKTVEDIVRDHNARFGRPLPPKEICGYLTPVAATLDFLNERRHRINGQLVSIMHCDAKPDNMLVFTNGDVRLGDFGLSVPLSFMSKNADRGGTPNYAAPEVFNGQISSRIDQFSLAVSYYLLRTGKLPFQSVDDFPLTPDQRRHLAARGGLAEYERLNGPQRQVDRNHPDLSAVSPAEQEILRKGLYPIFVNRWPSCGEMISKLSEATRSSSTVRFSAGS